MSISFSENPNVLANISFCDKECSNVNDNKTKADIVKLLESRHNIQIISKDYTLLNPNIMRNITYHQHVITTYTNGNPYLLFLTKIDGVNVCIYIDKKLKNGYTYPKMHCVKYRFDDSLFEKDTIFNGELIRDTERRWFFLIDNIVIYKGMNTNEKNILAKYELIHSILNNEYIYDKYLEVCPIQIKKLFLYKQIKYLIEQFIPTLSYQCKGLIFYTLNNRHTNYAYVMPREQQIHIKSSHEIDEIVETTYPDLWKKKHNICDEEITIKSEPIDNNTESINNNINNETSITDNNVVFRILKTDIPDIYNLYHLGTDKNLIKNSIALIPNIKISKYLYDTFKQNNNCLTMNIECKYSKIFEKWTPIKFVDNQPYSQDKIENIEKTLKPDL
jgi:hypothetical protein